MNVTIAKLVLFNLARGVLRASIALREVILIPVLLSVLQNAEMTLFLVTKNVMMEMWKL